MFIFQENKSVKENIEFSKEEFKKMEQKRLQETAQRQVSLSRYF